MTTEITTCYRHPDRRAGVRCQRCSRWICPDCMVQASVGFHCPECARSGRQDVRTSRQLFGAGGGFRPIVTQVLIGLNVAVFVLDVLLGGDVYRGGGEITEWGAVHGARLDVFPPLSSGVYDGEWWRLATGGFLHGGIIHLGMNMLVLYIIGPLLERELGKANFLLLYLTALFAGSLGVMLIDPFAQTVGASGAIYGLLGGAVALQLSRGINPWSSGIGGLILINVLITFTVPGISIGGHLGGLIGGFIAGWVLVKLDERATPPYVAPVICLVLVLAMVAASVWATGYAVDNLPGQQPVLDF